jgi:hypothetical protein
MRWVSSHCDPQAHHLKRWDGNIPDAPIFWGDNSLFRDSKQPTLQGVDTEAPGLLVFNFHPVHLFLNTYSFEQYEAAKPSYKMPEQLREHQNTSSFGVRDALTNLLEQAAGMSFATISHAVEALS